MLENLYVSYAHIKYSRWIGVIDHNTKKIKGLYYRNIQIDEEINNQDSQSKKVCAREGFIDIINHKSSRKKKAQSM